MGGLAEGRKDGWMDGTGPSQKNGESDVLGPPGNEARGAREVKKRPVLG